MSINSFMILTYCLSDLINLIGFQFYYRPHHLMMARVIVLLACIFILGKSKILVVGGRNFFKIQFFKAFRPLFCEVVLTYYLINVSRAHLLRTEVRGDCNIQGTKYFSEPLVGYKNPSPPLNIDMAGY